MDDVTNETTDDNNIDKYFNHKCFKHTFNCKYDKKKDIFTCQESNSKSEIKLF